MVAIRVPGREEASAPAAGRQPLAATGAAGSRGAGKCAAVTSLVVVARIACTLLEHAYERNGKPLRIEPRFVIRVSIFEADGEDETDVSSRLMTARHECGRPARLPRVSVLGKRLSERELR
jgi:hypothetical protein